MRIRYRGGYLISASAGFHKKTAVWVPTSGTSSSTQTWLPQTAFTHPAYTIDLVEEMHDLTPLKDGGLSDEELSSYYGFTFKGQKITKPMMQVKGGVTDYKSLTRTFTTDWPQAGGKWVVTYQVDNLRIPYATLPRFKVDSSDYSSAAFQIAGRNMLYQIGREVAGERSNSNLFVFLAEARELPRLLSLIMLKIVKTEAAWKAWDPKYGKDQFVPSQFKIVQGKTVLSKAEANAYAKDTYLGTQFGWMPLVNEIKELLLTIQDFQDRYIQLVKQQGAKFKKSKRKDLTIEEVVYSDYTYFGDGSAYRARDITTSRVSQMRAYARFAYRLPELPGGTLKTKLWLRALGLNPTPSKVWNLIPFTFILDWFFNFSKILRAFESELQSYDTFDAGFWWKGEIIRETEVEQWTGQGVYVPLGNLVRQSTSYFNRVPCAIPRAPIPADLLGTPDLQKALSLYTILSQRK